MIYGTSRIFDKIYMRFGLSSFYIYLIHVIYWVDTVMTGEGDDQEAAQAAAEQQAQQAQQFQAAQQLAQAQAQSQQAQQQYAASMAAAYTAQQILGQVPQ